MQYGEVRQAHFLERPNRFIAHVELEGETVVCHVKNTGRCRELLGFHGDFLSVDVEFIPRT